MLPRLTTTARIALITLALAGCGDYNIQLPRGYFLARIDSGAFAIVNPQNRVITPLSHNGVALAVVGDMVVGQIDPMPPLSGRAELANTFFIVNTATGEAAANLSGENYLAQLRELGIPTPPELVRATRFTTLAALRAATELHH